MKIETNKKIVMLGPPGAGKGTQADLLTTTLNIPHLDAGDTLREEIAKDSNLGKEAKEYVDEGKLVPDELIAGIMKERLKDNNGFVLDGFPRTLKQAEILSDFEDIDVVIDIRLSKNAGVERLSARRVCENCGKTYNLIYNPPHQEGICDRCGHNLYQRSDDKKEVIEKRFEVYEERTAPLKDYYRSREKLIEIDGERDIDQIQQDILNAVG